MSGFKPVIAALAWLVALAACNPRGESDAGYVEFILEDESRAPCMGTVPHLNRYIERAFGFFEIRPPDGFRVPIYVVRHSACDSGACYLPREEKINVEVGALDTLGYRPSAVLRHEIAHAVVDRVWGGSVSFFHEGLAESLSWTRSIDWASVSDAPLPVGDLLDQRSEKIDYTAAARFVRFLIDTRGMGRFRRFFQGAQSHSRDAIEALMLNIYGESFDALEAEYLSGAPRCAFQFDICDMETAEPVGLKWSVSMAASCDDPDFYGSASADAGRIGTQRTIEIEVAGTYRLITKSHIFLARCGDCGLQSVSEFSQGVNVSMPLDSGLYTVEFIADGDEVIDIELISE